MEKRAGYFRIGQITDIHLIVKNDQEDSLQSVESFKKTLEDAKKFDLDLLVFSGDLSEHSYREEYELFFRMIQGYDRPWCFITGNHDNSVELSKISPVPMALKEGNYFYKKDVNGSTIFFLDSSMGIVSKQQLEWLEQEAAKEKKEVFLFVHHPPCHCGHLFMDSRYALKNLKEVGFVLDRISNLHSIFVGHYHSAMEVDRGNGQTVYLTPSTQMQLDPDSVDFHILSTVPGWRYIEYRNGKLFTELRYL